MTAVAITVPGFPYGRFAGVDYGDCGTFKHEYGDGWYIGHIDPETMRADGLGMLKFANGSAYSGLCANGKRHGLTAAAADAAVNHQQQTNGGDDLAEPECSGRSGMR